jgi:HEAT repeat protein
MIKRLVQLGLASLIGLAGLAGGIWVLARILEDRPTLIQGKPAYYWLEQLQGRDSASSNQALTVLNSAIIPACGSQLLNDTSDSSFKLGLVDKLNALPGIHIVCVPADGRRAAAAATLSEFGPAAAGAIPVLLQVLQSKDDAVRGPAALALGKIHQEPNRIVPLLIKCLDDQEINAEAAEALANYGKAAQAAVPKLTTLLPVRDKELHRAVQIALKAIDPDAAAKAGVR